MASRARPEHGNFSAGELSPWLRNRSDLDRYANGAKLCRNFVCIPEGGLTRRPGSGFIRAQKTEAELGALIPFRYSGADSYMLVLNGGAIRFLRARGIILSAGSPYEVVMPWAAADVGSVRWAQEGNTAWLPCAGYEPRKLTRGSSHTDWTLSTYRPSGGPVKAQNLDHAKTIIASARTGTGISLLGVGTSFAAGHVGSVWRLDESDLSLTPNWKASETITLPTTAGTVSGAKIGDMSSLANAFDGNPATAATKTAASGYIGTNVSPAEGVYSATVTVSQASFFPLATTFTLYGKVGGAPANATDGTVLASGVLGVFAIAQSLTIYSSDTTTNWDYRWIAYSAPTSMTLSMSEQSLIKYTTNGALPVLRRYNGNVYEAIAGSTTGLTPPTHVDGDVLSEPGGIIWRYRHAAGGFVRITAVTDATHATADVVKTLPDSVVARPTYRWYEGAWNAIDGWPENVLLVDRGLFFFRGKDFWFTTVDNDNDFEVTTLDDSAIAQALRSRDGSLPSILWAADNGVIVLGCRDNEIILRAPGTFEAITGGNLRAIPGSHKGSCPQVPATLENGVIYISRSRQRLFFAAFDAYLQKLEPSEVSISGRHLLKNKAAGLGWQPDPWNVLWGYDQAGGLFGLTFNLEHKIAALHSHPMTNGIVEAVKAIPSSDEGVSDVYLIVRRTINGATHRYLEVLGDYFLDSGSGNAAGAQFFDSAVSYSGAPTAAVSAAHLALQQVGIIADNAAHKRITLDASGQGTLDRPASTITLGLPIDARVIDLPRNAQLQTGTTRGQMKRASHCRLDLVETIGGTVSTNGGRPEALQLTGRANYGTAPALFTGNTRAQMTGPIGTEVELTVTASDGMPMTLTGIAPDVETLED